jgi:phosphohistidine phosphatase
MAEIGGACEDRAEMGGDGTRKVYLVRHAFASHADPSQWPDDSKRPLTPDGIERFRVAAQGLRRLVPTVDVVLSSRFARAWETAVLLHEVAGWPDPEECPQLEVGWPAAAALEVLRRHSEPSVALVGHEPYLSTLASLLCAGAEDALRLQLKKGAVAVLRVDGDVEPGTAYLTWALQPKVLRALDGDSR